MFKIIADKDIPFLNGVLEPYANVTYLPGRQITRDTLKDADAILIRTRTKCYESNLKGTSVRFIGTATIGFDHIDTQYCEENNIKWTNAPGCNSSSVQQYIAGALLKMASESGFNLAEKTIGIIGVGNVGTKVEKFAGIMGMNVLLNDPPRARKEGEKNFVNFEKILYESDIVTVHVPLNIVGEDCTHHLFNDMSFKKINKGAWFINSSRGEIVDTIAVKNAIESGKLRGIVLDVWENEPFIDLELMARAFIATPHIAGYSIDGKANGTAMVVNALCKYFDLPLKDWYPGNVPQPPAPEILIDTKCKSDEEIIREAVSQTYNITADDIKLRFLPSDFEKQRGEYPLRREFPSYTVNLKGGNKKVQKMVKELGFKIKSLKEGDLKI